MYSDDMSIQETVSAAIKNAMPGWNLESLPEGFGWAPQRHLRTVLLNGALRQRVVIRQSWSDLAFQTERYLYESVLACVPFKTPRLIGTFTLMGDESPWMILEDIGDRTVADDPEMRPKFIEALGLLHGYGRRLCVENQLDSSRLRQFPASHSYFRGWQAILENGLESGRYALPETILSFFRTLREDLVQEPHTLLHGDTDPSNAIVVPNGISLVDWERASIGPASVDLGRVVSAAQLQDDMQLYSRAYRRASGHDMGDGEGLRVGGLGIAFDSLRWVCHYISQVEEGNDPGEDWRRANYEPCLGLIRAAAAQED